MGTKEHYEKNKIAILARQKNYYERNKEQILERQRKYVATHKEQHRAACQQWAKKNKSRMAAYYAQWRRENKEKTSKKNRDYKERMRSQVFEHYGNRCSCCGETRREFFAMDHVNGGGNKHRRLNRLTNAADLFLYIIRHNFPDEFRILCHNCNMSRGFYGFCPHERERAVAAESSSTEPSHSQCPESQGH
jgi:hypothetical protein